MTTIGLICKKRLLGDMKLLKKDPHQYIDVSPDENDILTWYFLIKGPEFSDFNNGYFIGKIMHNPEYPLKPPDFMMLTPNGRFDIGKKICLSNTGYHSSEWSAMWNMHTILTGFLSIMLDDKEHGISHIHFSKVEREEYSKKSIEYNKTHHAQLILKFSRFIDKDGNPVINPVVNPVVNPISETEIKPVVNPVAETEIKPIAETEIKPVVNPIAETEIKPIAETEIKPFVEPKEDVIIVTKRKSKPKNSKIFDPLTLKLTKYTKTDEEYNNLIKSSKN